MKGSAYRATRRWPYQVACGGVVYRNGAAGREYALLVREGSRRGGRDSWHLPKGTLRRDETLEGCALRETREECGLEAAIEGYLGTLHARFLHPVHGRICDRTTHYFLMRCAGETGVMDEEHDRLEWASLEQAVLRLSDHNPKGEAAILERAEAFLALQDE